MSRDPVELWGKLRISPRNSLVSTDKHINTFSLKAYSFLEKPCGLDRYLIIKSCTHEIDLLRNVKIDVCQVNFILIFLDREITTGAIPSSISVKCGTILWLIVHIILQDGSQKIAEEQ